jgi:hypothetical protein
MLILKTEEVIMCCLIRYITHLGRCGGRGDEDEAIVE